MKKYNKDEKLVSIILPIYNSEKYLDECLDSLINQTYKNLEIIAIDDGSTDKSLSILEEYKNIDSRIKIFTNVENKGLIYTLNKGFRISRGDYIARMDSDDICYKDRIYKQVNYLEYNKDIMVLGTGIEYFDRKKGKFKPSSDKEQIKCDLLFSSVLNHPTVMFRGDFIRYEKIKYNKNYIHAEDFELWSRISRNFEITNLNEVLLKYRVSKNNITNKYSEHMINTCYNIVKKNIAEFGFELDYRENILIKKFIQNNINKEEFKELKKLFKKFELYNKKYKVYDNRKFINTLDKNLCRAYRSNSYNKLKDTILYYLIHSKNIYNFILFIRSRI